MILNVCPRSSDVILGKYRKKDLR